MMCIQHIDGWYFEIRIVIYKSIKKTLKTFTLDHFLLNYLVLLLLLFHIESIQLIFRNNIHIYDVIIL